MTYRISLRSARAKLERAELHRNTLDGNIAEVFAEKSNRMPLRAERDPESGYHILRIQSTSDLVPILIQFGLLVGDAVHNMRGALDHLFWQLACFHTNGKPSKPTRVQFPMDEDPGTFSNQSVRNDIDPAHWDIIETHQPYHGQGDGQPDGWSGPYVHQLALLRTLTNDDKHRITTPVLVIPGGVQFTPPEGIIFRQFIQTLYEFEVPTTFEMFNVGEPAEVGAPVGRALLGGRGAEPEINDIGEVIPHVALSEGRTVVPTLDRLLTRVDLILGEFERFLTA